jgi:HAD superfamily hydrolase (TIGR01509 family)
MGYQGIIFDFNGVLCWDTAQQIEAWNGYALELRGVPFNAEELRENVIGRDNRYILKHLTGKAFEGAELAYHTEAKESIYRRLCLEMGADFQLSPGAAGLLDELSARGIRRSIATSAGKENMLFYFQQLGLERWFRFEQVVYDDDHIATKPAPDAYLLAARRLELAPKVCAVVEDSEHGIRAAREAGIGCIIALGAAEQHAQLMDIEGVRWVVENLGQVPVEALFKTITAETHRSQSL